MLYRITLFISFLFLVTVLIAQQDLPQDYLTKEFHKGRRDAARSLMPGNSVMVVFAAPTRTFANDVEYLYHQNPDLYYFTGYKEPHAVLLIFKQEQTDAAGNKFNEVFFVQQRNAASEHWNGRRIGPEGVKEKLGITNAYNGSAFHDFSINFTKFDKIIFDNIPDDVVRGNDAGDLYRLLTAFKEKAVLNNFDASINNFLESAKNNLNVQRLPQIQENLKTRIKSNPKYTSYPFVADLLNAKDTMGIAAFKEKFATNKYSTSLFRQITGQLREVKTAEELDLLRKAVEISCMGQNEVMRTVRPDMSELEIQGLHEYIHKKYGAEQVGYGSIIGAGDNGCILHYTENSRTVIGNNLLLMDVGAEYHGYTADVTRTVPARGKFTADEKLIYQLVYDAQEAAFKILKDGAKYSDANNAATEVIANGLLKLGIIQDKKDVKKYYTHGLGHHIGLDVHDKSFSQTLKKNMVLTIEPGIYIQPNSPCDKKWWGIAVRIEDDALITENGYELLSSFSPRSIEAIEKMMAEKSILDDYKLPPLQSNKKKQF
jgi:Xaa-Pro aminopeptidase